MSLMVSIQSATVNVLKVLVLFHRCQAVEGKLDISQSIGVRTEDALDGRVRRESVRFAIATTLIDSHHLKGEVTHLHILANQRLVILGVQFLGLSVTQHQHLSFLAKVNIVDEPAIEQVLFRNRSMNGIDTCNLHAHILLTMSNH